MVKDCKEYPAFMEKLTDMLEFLIPNYLKEGKNQLVISVGCTGGKHRSVTVANALYETLEKLPYTVRLYHRDIGKDRIVKGSRYVVFIKGESGTAFPYQHRQTLPDGRACCYDRNVR